MDKPEPHFYHLEQCYLCNGKGILEVKGHDSFVPEEEECPICEGKGETKVLLR